MNDDATLLSPPPPPVLRPSGAAALEALERARAAFDANPPPPWAAADSLGFCRARGCRKRVLKVATERGAEMPLDPEPNDDGNVILVTLGDDPVPVARVLGQDARRDPAYKGQLYMPHFATCPEAARFRKRKARGDKAAQAYADSRDDDLVAAAAERNDAATAALRERGCTCPMPPIKSGQHQKSCELYLAA